MEKFSLTETAHRQLDQVRTASGSRSATTVYGGTSTPCARRSSPWPLGNPSKSTRTPVKPPCTSSPAGFDWSPATQPGTGAPGDVMIFPNSRRALEAIQDAAVLLTVAQRSW